MLDKVKQLHARGSTFTEISGGVYTFVNGPHTPLGANHGNTEVPSHHAKEKPTFGCQETSATPQTTPESPGEPFLPSYTETVNSSRASGKSFVTSEVPVDDLNECQFFNTSRSTEGNRNGSPDSARETVEFRTTRTGTIRLLRLSGIGIANGGPTSCK
jgi:hypothetical protein